MTTNMLIVAAIAIAMSGIAKPFFDFPKLFTYGCFSQMI